MTLGNIKRRVQRVVACGESCILMYRSDNSLEKSPLAALGIQIRVGMCVRCISCREGSS